MKSIKFLQLVSFLSRTTAMLVGIFQSLVIVNILSTSEYGLIGLVVSIAGIAGIAQHLGLASSSTKEISSAKNDTEVFHIALTSISIRYLISLPIAGGLILLAPYISDLYSEPRLVEPLRIFGLVLLVQAVQSIFNSIISGKQQFKKLFTYQTLISFLSVIVFLPLVYFYQVLGYFYALLIFNIIQTIILGFLSLGSLEFKFSLPSKNEYYRMFFDLLKISLAIYFVKIIFTAWQEIPVLILGQKFSLEEVALFVFAFNFAGKLMSVSDSVTDVNLPVFSKKADGNIYEFFKEFKENFNFLYILILFLASVVVFWSKEILLLADYFVYFVSQFLGLDLTRNIFEKYSPSLFLFFPLVSSIVFYSFINILKSSIYVPLSRLYKMVLSYLILLIASFSFYYIFSTLNILKLTGLELMSWGLAFGALIAFLYKYFDILISFKVSILSSRNIAFTMLTSVVCSFTFYDLNLISKIFYFSIYFLVIAFVYKVNFVDLINKKRR